LEAKWVEVLTELVEYSNKNILRNFTLHLVMVERRREGYVKEVTSGILEIKPEDNEKGKEKEEQHHHNGSKNNNNQPWSTRLRDKNGRFMSSNTVATTAASSNTTTAVAITTTPTIATANHNHGIINYEIAGVGL
jgi:hypothetical protein